MKSEPKGLVSAEEEQNIDRKMLIWVNKFSDDEMPAEIEKINYEYLNADSVSMALSVIQSTYITRRFLLGGHQAEYQFKVVIRVFPGKSNDKRLKADALLNRLGDWALRNPPELGDGVRMVKIETTSRASTLAQYDDGSEDHHILMKMTYEVI